MKMKYGLIFILMGCLSTLCLAQPNGTITALSSDVSFKSDSTVSVSPAEISIRMELKTTTENAEKALSEHRAAQKEIFKQIEGFGVSYQGQQKGDFTARENSSFMRRKTTSTVTSNIQVSVITDNQLALVSELIGRAEVLSYLQHAVIYKEQDSVEGLQKTVTSSLLEQSQEYQNNNDRKLRPVGFSQMDISSRTFGDKAVRDMLEQNRQPQNIEPSAEKIKIMGVEHQIVAELIFR